MHNNFPSLVKSINTLVQKFNESQTQKGKENYTKEHKNQIAQTIIKRKS